MDTTTIWEIPYPESADAADIDQIRLLAEWLDSNPDGSIAFQQQGLLADRPAASKVGKRWLVQGDPDAGANGIEWIDTGSGWVPIGGGGVGDLSITTAKLANEAVTNGKVAAGISGAKLLDASTPGSKLADGGVTLAKLADALKPSTGAGAGAEALRKIGPGAGDVVAGNDPRLDDSGGGLTNGSVFNNHVNDAAAIAYYKLNLTGQLVNGDVAAGAGISESKLSLATDGAAGTGTRRTLGWGATQAAPGNLTSKATDLATHAALSDTAHIQAVVSALPGGAVNGQECILDAGGGVLWVLRFNSGAGKWDVLGGAPLFQSTDVNSSTTGATTYIDGAGGGVPVIVIPVAGDYFVSLGGRLGQNQPNSTTHLAPRTGAGGGSTDTDAASWNVGANATGSDISVARTIKKTYAAGTSIRLQFRSTSAVNSSGNVYNRFLSIMPARLG